MTKFETDTHNRFVWKGNIIVIKPEQAVETNK